MDREPDSWHRRKDGGALVVAPTIGRVVSQVSSRLSFGQKLHSLPAALWDFGCRQSSWDQHLRKPIQTRYSLVLLQTSAPL